MVDLESSVSMLKQERAKLIKRWEKSARQVWIDPEPIRLCESFVRIVPGRDGYLIPSGRVLQAVHVISGCAYLPIQIIDEFGYSTLPLCDGPRPRYVFFPDDMKMVVWPVPSDYADIAIRIERRVARW